MSDGIDKGELRKVCTEPTCPIHHPKKQTPKADASFKAEQEKRRREEALPKQPEFVSCNRSFPPSTSA